MQNNHRMIYPCPFSKRYSIPADQAWLLISIYFIYRLVLAGLFAMLYFSQMGPSLLGSLNPRLYEISSVAYVLVTIAAGIGVFLRFPSYPTQAQLLIFTDILFISLLMHSSGGVTTGIGGLLAVSIAAGGLLIGGRCALVFAAIATCIIFSEQIYAHLALDTGTAYTYTGMLGASFFTIALLSYYLARRTEESERLAYEQKLTIARLQELNHYIIQHLQSGIIIVDQNQQVSMSNEAALHLLDLAESPLQIMDISAQLVDAFEHWQKDTSVNSFNLQLAKDTQIQACFDKMKVHNETLCMIILSDMTLYNQRVQQSKLASLGRLTASIAHEIRNPLGSISHAGQLMSESPQLQQQDLRLLQIIETNSARIDKIVNDVLQLSKRKTTRREAIELVTWLKNYQQQFLMQQHLDESQIILQHSAEEIHILFDQEHLKQIMDNLCLNALKYGNASNDHMRIRIVYDLASHCYLLEVVDQGEGVSEENLSHLFEPFFTTSTTGTGLGLYICNELAELNQAKLRYYNDTEQANCFSLSIPDAETPIIEI